MSLTRKYSSTAFFSHSLTCQPPLPSGSATRSLALLQPGDGTSSTAGRVVAVDLVGGQLGAALPGVVDDRAAAASASTTPVACVDLAWVIVDLRRARPARRRAGRRAGLVVAGRWSCSSVTRNRVLDALAEGGDARVVHAQAMLAQHLRHVGQQAGRSVQTRLDAGAAPSAVGRSRPAARCGNGAGGAAGARRAGCRRQRVADSAPGSASPPGSDTGAMRCPRRTAGRCRRCVPSGPSSTRACSTPRPRRSSVITSAANRPSRSGVCTNTSRPPSRSGADSARRPPGRRRWPTRHRRASARRSGPAG